jgi:hypothetical protein
MSTCSFECLLQLFHKQLDLDKQIEVYDHLKQCDICSDAIYQLSHDLDGIFLIYCAHCVKQYAIRRHINAARSRRAQINANTSLSTTMR